MTSRVSAVQSRPHLFSLSRSIMFQYIQSFYDYTAVFSEYFSPAAAFWSIAKFAALGLIVYLVLINVCVRFKFFQRRNRYWNIIAKLYFPYIFIVCIGAGCAFGMLYYCKAVSDEAIGALVQPVNQKIIDYLQYLPQETAALLSLPELR